MNPLLLVLCAIRNSQTRPLIRKALEAGGHRAVAVANYAQAHLLIANGLEPDLVLLDDAPPGRPESDFYNQIIQRVSSNRVWLVSCIGEQQCHLRPSMAGARQYLPVVTLDKLDRLLTELTGAGSGFSSSGSTDPGSGDEFSYDCNSNANIGLPPFIEELGEGCFFLAASPKMADLHRQVSLLADTDVNVLILGESGSGKEIVARLIHKYSQRREKKFLKVNCAALPADLLESELFGYKQGAFTGAIKDLPGKFEQADRGTLFLDEIGEISVQLQAKLLHVLEDGEFSRLGAQHATHIDVRMLAATNIQMENALRSGTFREDLYYRLSVFTITVPPLRERREEIPYLIDEMIRRTPLDLKGDPSLRFPTRFFDTALLYDWPGNLRELRNVVTRTMIMRDPDAALRQLEAKIAPARKGDEPLTAREEHSPGTGMKSVVRDVKDRTEARMIQDALEVAGWNRRHAARSLNISYRALLYKIQQHRLAPHGLTNMNGQARTR